MARKDFKELDPQYRADGLRFGIAMSRFNEEIGDGLLSGASEELAKLGAKAEDVTLVTVPGALELPLALLTMAKSGRFDALIALGCVIRGETYHFEIVSNESSRGISEVQLDTGVPIANAVLTTENDDQARARMAQKGREAAQCAVEMIHLLKAFK
jgi:6,7-dimethyl-8-ribityllumazine synthase